jgi:hypothetical protein
MSARRDNAGGGGAADDDVDDMVAVVVCWVLVATATLDVLVWKDRSVRDVVTSLPNL